ncbi:MAG: hypothetical protein QGF74_02290 [Candidatus Nanoarchaeia archaeon]|jgi:hypothetical protein|nr:hypothetical protein [Candidatus Nanoarchaeia archaeon]|tara:strand:- start:8534 stop:8800 length:267 start_codon:yes stop_codon:yes gene_type:complete
MKPRHLVYDLCHKMNVDGFTEHLLREGYRETDIIFSPDSSPSRRCVSFSRGLGFSEGVIDGDLLYILNDLDGEISPLDKVAKEYQLQS